MTGQKGCIPEGTKNIGDACNPGECKKGGICVNGACEIPCDPTNAMSCTDPNQICSTELGFSNGTTLGFRNFVVQIPVTLRPQRRIA